MQDHIERQNIDLSHLQFRVLDEADEMLRMGFVEDVELILGICKGVFVLLEMKQLILSILYLLSIISGKVEDATKVQTLLFSATLPSWVKNVRSFKYFLLLIFMG